MPTLLCWGEPQHWTNMPWVYLERRETEIKQVLQDEAINLGGGWGTVQGWAPISLALLSIFFSIHLQKFLVTTQLPTAPHGLTRKHQMHGVQQKCVLLPLHTHLAPSVAQVGLLY